MLLSMTKMESEILMGKDKTLKQISRDLINKNLTVKPEDLAPWQLWYLEHLYCGGTFELKYNRKGQASLICTCIDKR